MKKKLCLALALLFALTMLTACGQSDSGNSSAASVTNTKAADVDESPKTIGEVLALEGSENTQFAYGEDTYVYVYDLNGTYYRAVAAIPPETSKEIQKLDNLDASYEEKLAELVSPLTIDRFENLSELMPTQEELDKLIGKTGQDLLDDNWVNSGYNLDTMEFFMEDELFSYTVTFDGKLKMSDDLDAEKEIKPLKIKSVVCEGLGVNAMNVDE